MKIFNKLNRAGFGHVEAFVFILVIAFVAVGGIYVSKHNSSHALTATTKPTKVEVRQAFKRFKDGPIKRVTAPAKVQSNLQASLGNVSASNTGAVTETPNWAGYVASNKLSFTVVRSNVKVPTVTCGPDDATAYAGEDLFWVGFDGYYNTNVEQTGIGAICPENAEGPAAYIPWWEMYPTNQIQTFSNDTITMKPGDVVQMEVIYNSGVFVMKVTDKTTNQSDTAKATCGAGIVCDRESAEWIVERPYLGTSFTSSGWADLLKFNQTHMNVDYASVGSTQSPIGSFLNFPVDMVNDSFAVLAGPRASLNKNDSGFYINWHAVQ